LDNVITELLLVHRARDHDRFLRRRTTRDGSIRLDRPGIEHAMAAQGTM
jgi:hypothetical protein